MYLKDLCLIQFKNYEEAQLNFSSNINCFVGNNGSGKTNLLDAIYYMCFCKSYFNSIDTQNVNFEKQFFTIEGTFDRKDQVDKVFCGVKRGQKKVFKRNKKHKNRTKQQTSYGQGLAEKNGLRSSRSEEDFKYFRR